MEPAANDCSCERPVFPAVAELSDSLFLQMLPTDQQLIYIEFTGDTGHRDIQLSSTCGVNLPEDTKLSVFTYKFAAPSGE